MRFEHASLLWLLLVVPPALVLFFWWGSRMRRKLLTQFVEARLFRKARNLEVGTMHPQQQLGTLVDGLFVIPNPSAVRGADFAQLGLRFLHYVRNAERAADFDQFSAGHDDFAALRQRVQGQ